MRGARVVGAFRPWNASGCRGTPWPGRGEVRVRVRVSVKVEVEVEVEVKVRVRVKVEVKVSKAPPGLVESGLRRHAPKTCHDFLEDEG